VINEADKKKRENENMKELDEKRKYKETVTASIKRGMAENQEMKKLKKELD